MTDEVDAARQWQADEAESLAALARGEGLEFSCAADLIRWLQADDDDAPPSPTTTGAEEEGT